MEILVAWSLNGPSKWQQLTAYLGWPGPRVLLPPAGVTAPRRHPLPHDALTSQLKVNKAKSPTNTCNHFTQSPKVQNEPKCPFRAEQNQRNYNSGIVRKGASILIFK